MENITDSSFRMVCRSFGADLVVSEFISSEGLIRDASKSKVKLDFEESERPVSIQIFGHDIASMKQAAELAERADPDLIDLNFGCPVRKVVRKGAGAALLKDIPRMVSMTDAVVRAVKKPVTVKTRIGWDSSHICIEEVSEMLQDKGIAAIAVHGRTAVQQYGGLADWSWISRVKQNPRLTIPVIGNGDITNALVARDRLEESGVDGLMIGRASMGNPWIFRDIRTFLSKGVIPESPDLDERIGVLRQHLTASVKLKGARRAILEFRKFYNGYFKGLPHMKPWRLKLMQASSMDEIDEILEDIRDKNLPPAS